MFYGDGMKIIEFDPKYKEDMIDMYLSAKEAISSVPQVREDLLNIETSYFARGDMFWLALDDSDRVVGCIGITREGDFAWLKRLSVKPDLKRNGIGSALLSVAENFVKDNGISEIHVHLGDEVRYFESYHFYPKHGYELYSPRHMKKCI